jgi:hypothetical protein
MKYLLSLTVVLCSLALMSADSFERDDIKKTSEISNVITADNDIESMSIVELTEVMQTITASETESFALSFEKSYGFETGKELKICDRWDSQTGCRACSNGMQNWIECTSCPYCPNPPIVYPLTL